MIKDSKIIIAVILITILVTTGIVAGIYTVKNNKQESERKIIEMQKTIDNLNQENKDMTDIESKKIVELDHDVKKEDVVNSEKEVKQIVAPVKIEKEALVSCLTYANTTVQVSESECNLIKQKNEKSKDADKVYAGCLAQCRARFSASVPVLPKSQYDKLHDDGAYDDRVDDCKKDKESCNDKCKDLRRDLMEAIWE